MVSTSIRDLLTAFSPSLDYFAISVGDGRIKIWDTVKGQVQTEFADITSSDANFYPTPERGHLSVDYTCMKWLSLDRKKKRKLGNSFLVLGTGSGDVLALDVSAGQLKWSVSDCHPGGVSAISFSTPESCIYTAGTDGFICKIDPQTGNVLEKSRASSKAISCISVSPDGKTLATAAAQLKVLNSAGYRKIQKFSGHPGAVHSMIFSEDGKYILSSAVGERYIALWRIDGGKKQSASCVLAMEHPAVFLDSRCFQNNGVDDMHTCVLAVSEAGVCYAWHGQNIEELRDAKPTKVSMSYDEFPKNHRGALPTIFGAKLQNIVRPLTANVFIAYGMLVKPLFQKILVNSGIDIKLNSSHDGVLLPVNQVIVKSKKGLKAQNRVTALDRANVEDAVLPFPRVSDFCEKKGTSNEVMADLIDSSSQAEAVEDTDEMTEVDTLTPCMEEQLRHLKIITTKDDNAFSSTLDSATLMGINLEAYITQKKMRAAVLSMGPSNVYKLLEVLVARWQSRSHSGNYVLPWIYSILVNYGHSIMAHEKPETQMLSSLLKITKSREVATQPLLQLSGRLQLATAQVLNLLSLMQLNIFHVIF
uniref:Small-subunit processome Utp12 domain-containing protein n=1 Tax=Rhizophora mucronata TaxID=61149 RepID=A0A2P2L3U5_RHIMU